MSTAQPQNELMQADNSMSVDEYLAQLHADYDPVYSLLMNYQCAVMEVETKFNVLNNRLSIQGEHNPIESIKSRVKSLDSTSISDPVTQALMILRIRKTAGLSSIRLS